MSLLAFGVLREPLWFDRMGACLHEEPGVIYTFLVEIFIRVLDIQMAFDLCEGGVLQVTQYGGSTLKRKNLPSICAIHYYKSLRKVVLSGMLHFPRLNHIFLVKFTLLLLPAIYSIRA